MRLLVVAVAVFSSVLVLEACTTSPRGGAAAGPQGERYFKAKCQACHPDGKAGVGPAIIGSTLPGPLKKSSTGGRHNVPDAEYDALIAFLQPMAAGAMAAAPAEPVPAPDAQTMATPAPAEPMAPAPAAPAAATTPLPIPQATGVQKCTCDCICPAGLPANALANCQCQCRCPGP